MITIHTQIKNTFYFRIRFVLRIRRLSRHSPCIYVYAHPLCRLLRVLVIWVFVARHSVVNFFFVWAYQVDRKICLGERDIVSKQTTLTWQTACYVTNWSQVTKSSQLTHQFNFMKYNTAYQTYNNKLKAITTFQTNAEKSFLQFKRQALTFYEMWKFCTNACLKYV